MDAASERELEAHRAIALAAYRGLDVHGVIEAALDAVHAAFRASTTAWSRVAGDRVKLESHRGGEGLPPGFADFPVGQGLTGLAAATRRPQTTADWTHDPRSEALRQAAPSGAPLYRGLMAVPIVLGDELVGTVTVASLERAFSDTEFAALRALGVQLVSAVENGRLVGRLRTSEARYRSFVEAMPCTAYEGTPDGRLHYVSPKIEDLTGHAPARFERDRDLYPSLVHPEDRAARAAGLATLKHPGDRAALEYRLVHANGVDLSWVSDQAVAREASAGEPLTLAGVLVDLRERKLLEAAAREHARLASLGELAAGVAHEVNNPLSGVLNYAQLARRILAQGVPPATLTSKLVEPLEGIVSEAERILEITRTLVSFARRPEQEAFRAQPVHELVRASLTIMKQRLKENSIALEVDVPPDLPPVRARGHELTQVLQHLITNARHALNERFPRWDPQKRLSFRATRTDGGERWPEGLVRIEVTDQGCGISPQNLPRVFVPFYTTKPQGTGLGLSISRDIVQAHGGTMDVRSSADGTTVSFTVPVY